MAYFVDAIRTLESIGLSDVLLPFLLIFTIIYAIITKVKILGERKGINVVFSLTIALIVVIPHVIGAYPANMDAVVIINTMIPNLSLVVVAVFALLVLIGVFGGKPKTHNGATFAYIVIFAILFNVFFNESFPTIAPVLLWITLFYTLWGIWGSHGKAGDSFIPGWIAIIAFLFVFFAVTNAMGLTQWPEWLEWMRDPTTQSVIIILVVMFGAAAFITKGSSKGKT